MVVLLQLLTVDSNVVIVIDESSVCGTHNNLRLKAETNDTGHEKILIL